MSSHQNSCCSTAPGSKSVRQVLTFRPDIDIVETADELVITADVPGAGREDLDIRFENGTLTLQATVAPRHAETAGWLAREYGVGDFHRSLELGESIDAERISADIADGVVTIRLPKAAAVKPRKIEVRAAS